MVHKGHIFRFTSLPFIYSLTVCVNLATIIHFSQVVEMNWFVKVTNQQ